MCRVIVSILRMRRRGAGRIVGGWSLREIFKVGVCLVGCFKGDGRETRGEKILHPCMFLYMKGQVDRQMNINEQRCRPTMVRESGSNGELRSSKSASLSKNLWRLWLELGSRAARSGWAFFIIFIK